MRLAAHHIELAYVQSWIKCLQHALHRPTNIAAAEGARLASAGIERLEREAAICTKARQSNARGVRWQLLCHHI